MLLDYSFYTFVGIAIIASNMIKRFFLLLACGFYFPQAFSHIALVDTAFNLGRADEQDGRKPAEQRQMRES